MIVLPSGEIGADPRTWSPGSNGLPNPQFQPQVPDLKPQITLALNTIDRIKSDPELSKRIATTIGSVISPLLQPMTNMKTALIDPVTTYVPLGNPMYKVPAKTATPLKKVAVSAKKPVPKKPVVYQETMSGEPQGGGATKLAPKPMGPAPGRKAVTTPSALNRALTSLSNLETSVASSTNAITTINTNLSELLEAFKAANVPAAAENQTTNNSQEGGRRKTKGNRKRRGRRGTRR